MQEFRMVWYVLGVALRTAALLFLINLAGWLWPLPDPFTRIGFMLVLIVAVVAWRPARTRVLSWMIGTPPAAVTGETGR
jgi:hypothetical protein